MLADDIDNERLLKKVNLRKITSILKSEFFTKKNTNWNADETPNTKLG